jgi:hypothetical protein
MSTLQTLESIMKNAFILDTLSLTVVGVFRDGVSVAMSDKQILIHSASALLSLTRAKLQEMYQRTIRSKGFSKFTKAKLAEAIFANMFYHIDATDEVLTTAAVDQDTNQIRVRTFNAPKSVNGQRISPLDLLKQAFIEHPEGLFLEELQFIAGTNDRLAKQYISILRASTDRFQMNITNTKAGLYKYVGQR